MGNVRFEAEQLPHLADILMAGAHADAALDGREVDAVRTLLLSRISDATELPDELSSRIDAFDRARFDLAASTKGLGALSSEHRRAVLEMLSQLSEVDEEIDFAEDEFLREVAAAMGATPEESAGLTLDIELVVTPKKAPPPLPPLRKK